MQETEPSNTEPSGPISGMLQSLTQVFATLVAMLQTRVELLTAELQEEIQRAANVVLWAAVALIAAGIGLFLAALVVILIFWDTHRVLVSMLVTAAFLLIAVFAMLRLRRQLHDKPRLLNATLIELARDRQRLDERFGSRE
ncbi:MAG: phage holin family protein [Steroidobacteraceae bacterium]